MTILQHPRNARNKIYIINIICPFVFIIRFKITKPQCSAKGLNWKKMALKRKIHGWDRMIMLNTGTALKYSNLVEVITFLGKN